MSHPVLGLHHITAITGDLDRNVDSYTRALGLRLVKQTVNYDHPASYHLCYGDALGRPGTGQVSAVASGVPEGSLDFWQERLAADGIERGSPPILTRFSAAGA